MGFHYTLYCDGACRGNPGPASVGVVLYRSPEDESPVLEISKTIGKTTNNVAEYTSLLEGVTAYRDRAKDGDALLIRMDSELVVKQMNGIYRVKHPALQGLHRSVKTLLTGLKWKIEHVRREKNEVADALANAALDAW